MLPQPLPKLPPHYIFCTAGCIHDSLERSGLPYTHLADHELKSQSCHVLRWCLALRLLLQADNSVCHYQHSLPNILQALGVNYRETLGHVQATSDCLDCMTVLPAQVCSCHVIRVAAVEKAEAEKIAVVKAAEGDAESKYLQGQVSVSQCCVLCNLSALSPMQIVLNHTYSLSVLYSTLYPIVK